jgi:hypothetical protein
MAAQAVDAGAAARRAHDRVGRQRRGDQPGLGIAHRTEQPDQRTGGGELRAVDQRQPFLGPQSRRAEPRRAKRLAAGHALPPNSASPSPIIAAAICASGARSPDAPTEPCAGITGVTPLRQHVLDQPITWPSARPRRRGRATAASAPSSAGWSATSSGSPTPQQCDRIRLRCSVAVSSALMRTLASLPKPVLTP